MILGLTLVVVLAFGVINLLVDLSYAWFDPRVRLGSEVCHDRLELDVRVSGEASSSVTVSLLRCPVGTRLVALARSHARRGDDVGDHQ